MELAFDDRCSARIDRLHEPFAFDGGWNTRCRLLDGPVRNMNLIVDRRRGMGSIALLVPSETATLAVDAPWLSLYCVHGALEVDTPAGEHRLERGDLLRVDDAIGTALVPRDVRRDTMLAVIRVHSREAFSRSAGTVDDERASR
jgi:environmental stress-induced protein Ves